MATKKEKRPQTPNRGAADLVDRVVRKVKRMRFTEPLTEGEAAYNEALTDVEDWLRDWDKRAAKRPGGLGKR